jgi:hypothetical protein
MPIDPLYGIELTANELTNNIPMAPLYVVTPNNKFIPAKADAQGRLELGAVTLEIGDLEIGAIELKDHTTDDRVHITPDNEIVSEARLHDESGIGITSTLVGIKQGIDVNVVGGTAISASTDEDDSVPASMTLAALINLTYGYDGVDWQRINSTAGRMHVDGSGVTQPISAVSLPLPTGAATEATLATRATEATLGAVETNTDNLDVLLSTRATELTLSTLNAKFVSGTDIGDVTINNGSGAGAVNIQDGGNTITVDGTIAATQSGTWDINNISGTISLPTGAATEATLSTLATEATLSSFRTDFNAVDFATETTLAGIKAATDNLTFAATRLLVDGSGVTQPVSGTITADIGTTGGLLLDSTFTGRINTLGQKLSAASTPVVLASDQSAIPVSQSGTWDINNISGTISLPTGAATEATLSTLNGKIPSGLTVTSTRLLVDGSGVTQPISAVSLPLPTGAATEATLATRATEATLATRLADATFTGRINTLGQKTMANSTPVVLASDQSFLQSSTATLSNIAASATSVTLLASNTIRRGASIHNDSNQILYVKFGTTASSSSYTVRMVPQAHYEVPFGYTGQIDGIWVSANGNARVTELT